MHSTLLFNQMVSPYSEWIERRFLVRVVGEGCVSSWTIPDVLKFKTSQAPVHPTWSFWCLKADPTICRGNSRVLLSQQCTYRYKQTLRWPSANCTRLLASKNPLTQKQSISNMYPAPWEETMCWNVCTQTSVTHTKPSPAFTSANPITLLCSYSPSTSSNSREPPTQIIVSFF